MFSWILPWKKELTIEDRRKRFPFLVHQIQPNQTRKIGISNHQINPKHIEKIILDYYESLQINSIKYSNLKDFISIIIEELKQLDNYPMEDVERILILNNRVVLFDFYLIYDLHIHDPETIYINLDPNEYNKQKSSTSIFGNTISSLATVGSLASIGSLVYFIQNLF
jgi:hypothetical protein